MAGHSKWANIKHRKAAQDAKRGKLFTKLVRALAVTDHTQYLEAGDADRPTREILLRIPLLRLFPERDIGALQGFRGFLAVTQCSLAVPAQARLQAGQCRYESGILVVVWGRGMHKILFPQSLSRSDYRGLHENKKKSDTEARVSAL